MLFSKFVACVLPDNKHAANKYQESLEQIQLADAIGFRTVFLSENHFSSREGLPNFKGEVGITPSPLTFGMQIIENTRTIRVGTAIRNIIFNHPIHIAEEALVFDLLSKGRLDLGIGSGYRPWEFIGWGIDPKEAKAQFLEAVEILDQGMRGKPFSFTGKYYDIPEVTLVPGPYYTQPRPEIYLATGDPMLVELAAQKDFGVMSFSTSSKDHLVKIYNDWTTIARPLGYNCSKTRFPLTRQIYIHSDPAKVDEFVRRNLPNYKAALPPNKECPSIEELKKLYITGNPEECVQQIKAIRDEMACEHVILWFNFGWLSHQEVMDQMALFHREVMPHFEDSGFSSQTNCAKLEAVCS